MARVCNDWMSEEIQKNPKRLGAFCSLSMHDPKQAAEELRRSIQELGMVGAILNDWQSTGSDGNGITLFDSPDFDPFWKMVQDLDVPVYFHPRWPNSYQMETLWKERQWLVAATCQFHVYLTVHIMALCAGGVFDRFPGAKIIVGHLGENIPTQLVRSDAHAIKWGKWHGSPMRESYTYYFQKVKIQPQTLIQAYVEYLEHMDNYKREFQYQGISILHECSWDG